jgi:N-acetylmuramoyl-L-alanine amidase
MKKKSIFYSVVFLVLMFFYSHIAQAATPQDLINKYNAALKTGNKVKVLIVPGHDDDYWGTQFKDIRESDVVVAIGQYLFDYLKNDPRLDVILTRPQMGYNPIFKDYFANSKESIQNFISTSRSTQATKINQGQVKLIENVPHNNALPEVALRLYGINKWANENNVDVALHLHVNDQGGRVGDNVGDYKGLAIYIPENQYGNASSSAAFGKALFKELNIKNATSTYPAESAGLIEDQDLIAIGAADTVKNAVALVEYGYIYEPRFQNLAIQETVTKDLAHQTFLGIHRFFGDRDNYVITSLKKDLKKGSTGTEVSALQKMLTQSGVYSCGVTATFGPCTEKGVKDFQKKYKIDQTGTVGPKTRAKLNSLVEV